MDQAQDNRDRLAVATAPCPAGAAAAWRVLADVPGWASWYPGMRAAAGRLVAGEELDLEFAGPPWEGGGRVRARVEEVAASRSMTLVARRGWSAGYFTFRIEEGEEGCRVSVRAFLTGVRLPVLAARLARRIQEEGEGAVAGWVAGAAGR